MRRTANITSWQVWIIQKQKEKKQKLLKNYQLINRSNMGICNLFFLPETCHNSYMPKYVANKRSEGNSIYY